MSGDGVIKEEDETDVNINDPIPVVSTEPPALVAEAEESHILPVYIFTAIFGLIFIVGPLLVRPGPNRSITRVCIMISTVCCWIFWTTLYIVQMNPLLGPRLSNHSLAWIGHKWLATRTLMTIVKMWAEAKPSHTYGHDAAFLTTINANATTLSITPTTATEGEETTTPHH